MPPTREQVKQLIRQENIGEADRGTYKGQNWKLKYHFEPWYAGCLSDEELDACKQSPKMTDRAIEDKARDKSREIAKEEGWDGFYYFYADEFNIAPYGGAFFYNAERV